MPKGVDHLRWPRCTSLRCRKAMPSKKTVSRWRARIDAGKCGRCGMRNRQPTRNLCEQCKTDAAAAQQARRAALDRRNLCIQCGKRQRAPDRTQCQKCLDERAERERVFRSL